MTVLSIINAACNVHEKHSALREVDLYEYIIARNFLKDLCFYFERRGHNEVLAKYKGELEVYENCIKVLKEKKNVSPTTNNTTDNSNAG